jgi:hypothetical protein
MKQTKQPKITEREAAEAAIPRPAIPRTLPLKPGREQAKVVSL